MDVARDRDDFVEIDLLVGPLNLLRHSTKPPSPGGIQGKELV